MITTIIFDLSEVILHGMKGIGVILEELLGVEVSNEIYLQKESEQFFHGQISEDEYWKKLIRKYKWDILLSQLKLLIRSKMIEVNGTREIVEKLYKNNYRLGLLSVHGKEWVEHCEDKFKYHKLFHTVMYSFEVGISKPDPKSFLLILEKLNVGADECLFIDDYSRNTDAAASLGMKTILFTDSKQLHKDLQKLDIKV